MELQWDLASDIHIAFDDCTPYPVTEEQARLSLNRTHRWARESLEAHRRLMDTRRGNIPAQFLYGVVQGSVYEHLRVDSARTIDAMDFDGLAIGGAVGESKEEMRRVLTWTRPYLPEDKPLHLLGVGEIDDVFVLVSMGIDTFDCVQPTRLARMGRVLVSAQNSAANRSERESLGEANTIDITRRQYAEDVRPLEPGCRCAACRTYTRAYIHHLFHVKELLAYRLTTIHNLSCMVRLLSDIQNALEEGIALEDVRRRWVEGV